MQTCSCYAPSYHLPEIHVLLFCKIRHQSNFLSIYSPAYKTYLCMIYSHRLVTLNLKMATRLFYMWKHREMLSFYVCVYGYNKVVQCNYILKSSTMWMYWQKYFQWFYWSFYACAVFTKQHYLTSPRLSFSTPSKIVRIFPWKLSFVERNLQRMIYLVS